jgi:uncharacterized LabA/DUF88 family protein
MTQIAVFVDSGYLYAQGSFLVSGQRSQRRHIQLDVRRALNALYKVRKSVAADARLLRVYWYDGIPRGGTTTPAQEEIALAPYVKLRLGIIKSDGGQKGVDSLIVLDLIELARNRAITDALIVSGDEDIRAGVQVAQNHGVRVHLLSIGAARRSQSPDLVKEADTLTEWQSDDLSGFLTVSVGEGASTITSEADTAIEIEIEATVSALAQVELSAILPQLDAVPPRIPAELDRTALGRIRTRLGRELEEEEKRRFRSLLATAVRCRAALVVSDTKQADAVE